MEFYFFGGHLSEEDEGRQIQMLHDNNISGALFTYDNNQGDFFTRVARDIKKDQKFKYMIAIRPYTISPQYLTMIHQSIDEIDSNRLQINLISGHIKSHEKRIGGILGNVTDKSSHIDKSNYLIEYLYEFDKMKKQNPKFKFPDYYVSTSNKYVFDAAKKLGEKMIIQYREYTQGCWTEYEGENDADIFLGESFEIVRDKTMISLNPVLRKTKEEIDSLEKIKYTTDTEYFTYQEFENWIKKIESEGIHEILLIVTGPTISNEKQYIFDFIKEYKEKYKE